MEFDPVARGEWSRFFPATGTRPEVLNARFVQQAFARHTHDEYVIGLAQEGAGRMDLGRTAHDMPAGSVFLINPAEVHTGGTVGLPEGYIHRALYPTEALMFEAAEEVEARGSPSLSSLPSFSSVVIFDPELFRVLLAFHHSVTGRAPALEQETHLRTALSLLLFRHTQPGAAIGRRARAPRAARRARDYLQASYTRDVTLSELAGVCGYSPFHLARAFAAAFGLPPHAYLNGLRIARAKQMIQVGTPLSQIALDLGFCDQSHFNRRFKKAVGVAPGEYARDTISSRKRR